jgi:hypothetical protein
LFRANNRITHEISVIPEAFEDCKSDKPLFISHIGMAARLHSLKRNFARLALGGIFGIERGIERRVDN